MEANMGAWGGRLMDLRRAARASTGHRYLFLMVGSWMIWWNLRSYIVLVHFRTRWAPGGPKITS